MSLFFFATPTTYPMLHSEHFVFLWLFLIAFLSLCVALDKNNWDRRVRWASLLGLVCMSYSFLWFSEYEDLGRGESLREIIANGDFKTREGIYTGHVGSNRNHLVIDGENIGSIRSRTDYRCVGSFEGLYFVNKLGDKVYMKSGDVVKYDYLYTNELSYPDSGGCIFRVWLMPGITGNELQ